VRTTRVSGRIGSAQPVESLQMQNKTLKIDYISLAIIGNIFARIT